MNFCTKCASLYAKPGTCNCYAEAQPAVSPWVPVYPIYPSYPTYPMPWYQQFQTGDVIPPLYETTCGTGHHTTGCNA